MLVEKLKKPSSLAIVAALLMASILPAVISAKAHAYGLLGSRFIEMSSSKQADTDVQYNVSFNVATAGAIGGVVVDFCGDSPIIGDTCTAPTGFDVNEATLNIASPSAAFTSPSPAFSINAATDTNTLIYTSTAGTSSQSSGTTLTFTLGDGTAGHGVTNPNTTNTTFYARILTFDTAANAAAYSSTAANGGTGAIDAGGVALSTANQITVTSKVQERLAFCVYTGANCAAGGSSVALGNDKGVLDPNGAFVDKNTKYDVSTNAANGVTIRLKGDTLVSGSFNISAIGGTATASSPGSEQFGLCTYQSTGSGLTPDNLYDGDSAGTTSTACTGTTQTAGTASTGGDNSAAFAFDTTNTNTTYGQPIATKTAGTSSTGVISFIGNISNTTEAAIYTTTLTFVATGTY
jgi:hypothetical protein